MMPDAPRAGRPWSDAWTRLACAICACAVAGCGVRRGVEVTGAVTRPDGRTVDVGEVWLEPAGDAVADVRPVRTPIRGGRYRFEAAAGVQPGAWRARVQPPPLGPGASPADIAGAFKPRFESVTVGAAGAGGDSFDFEIEPVEARPPE